MMKPWAFALSMTMLGSLSNAHEVVRINESVTVKKVTYSIKEEPYEAGPGSITLVSTVNELIKNYHLNDPFGLPVALPYYNNNPETYRTYLETEIQKSATRYAAGETRLLGIFKNGERVGGAYFSVKQNGAVVCIEQAGFKAGLPLMELAQPQKMMIESLSSHKYFLGSRSLVLYLRLNSGFVEGMLTSGLKFAKAPYESYESADHPKTEYQPFARNCG